jgi:hypothetical protein
MRFTVKGFLLLMFDGLAHNYPLSCVAKLFSSLLISPWQGSRFFPGSPPASLPVENGAPSDCPFEE